MKKGIILTLVLMSLMTGYAANCVADQGKWFVSVYAAQATDNSLNHMIRFDMDMIDYYLAYISVGKEFYQYKDKFNLEFEIMVAEHFKHQRYEEVNAVFSFRWLKFPWDRYLDTSFAFADGLSYAFEESELEALRHDDTAKLLNYLEFEWAFNLPAYPEWVLFLQVYHRSGMFETFSGVSGASNLVGAGIKYRF